MGWIKSIEVNSMRGDIEPRPDFVRRNIEWWWLNRRFERGRRKPYYHRFLDFGKVLPHVGLNTILGEVGPGPFGGILETCNLQARHKVFIDYIMEDLCKLNFIKWPEQATYVEAAAEAIPLRDDEIDVLLSYNALDHGWDTLQGIRESLRVSKRCFLAFDCRGDDKRQKDGHDLDHYQSMKFEDIFTFLRQEMPSKKQWWAGDMKFKHFPVIFISAWNDE